MRFLPFRSKKNLTLSVDGGIFTCEARMGETQISANPALCAIIIRPLICLMSIKHDHLVFFLLFSAYHAGICYRSFPGAYSFSQILGMKTAFNINQDNGSVNWHKDS